MKPDRKPQAEPIEPLLSALANPVRAQVLAVLADRDATAAELAELIGEPPGKVRYHLRALAESGLIGWERAKDRRGAREYSWISRTPQLIDEDQYRRLNPEQIRLASVYVLRLIFSDATAGLREGAFARRRDTHLVRVRPEVDERGWGELVDVYRSSLAAIEKIGARAAKRLEKSEDDPVLASASLLLFDLEAPARPVPAAIPPPRGARYGEGSV